MHLRFSAVVFAVCAAAACQSIGLAAAPHDRALANFHSPSNNVRCAVNAQRVVCVTLEPKRGARIFAGQRAARRGYLALPAGSLLRYGQTTTVGRFSCSSASSGMKCRDRRTGHAFRISRQKVELLNRATPGGGTPSPGGGCDPNYSGACVPRYPPDVDCSQIPATNFRVVGVDVHGLDRDGNGIACES